MALDSALAIRYVMNTLTGDSTFTTAIGGSKVYRDKIPRGVALPAVAVNIQSTDPPINMLKAAGRGARTWQRVTVKVRLSDQDKYTTIETAASRADDILDGATFVAVTGGTVYECIRLEDLSFGEDIGDIHYKHIDLFYGLRARST